MIIERLDLIAYGQFTDVSLDLSASPHRFHLVYGENESGKSTCMRAITSLLYGIANRTTDNYLHANPKMRIGAKLSDRDGQSLTVIRRKTGKSKLNAEDDKTPVDEALLSQLLGGIDQETFHQRFGMSHDELVAGGKSILDSKGELGTILFAAGAGISQLKSIQGQLDADRKALFLENARKPLIQTLLKELDEKRKELRKLQTLPAEYKQLRDQLGQAERLAEELSTETLACQRSKDQLAAYRSMLSVVPQWRSAKERLDELKDVPTLDDDFAARRRESARDREHLEKTVQSFGQELANLEKQLDKTSKETQILSHEDDIVSLFQEIAARHTASIEKSGLQNRIAELNRSLLDHLKELEIELDLDVDQNISQDAIDAAITNVHVNESTLLRIRELAAEYKLLRANESDAKQRLEVLQKQLSELDAELERTPTSNAPTLLDSVLNEIGPPDTAISAIHQRQIECDDLQAECNRLGAELNLGRLDLEQAARLQVPSMGDVDEHDASLSEAKQQHTAIESTLSGLRQRRSQAEESLRQLRSNLDLPTETELADSRQQRDQTVEELQAEQDSVRQTSDGLQRLKGQIKGSDQVVDTIRSHHQQVAQRQAAIDEITALDKEVANAEQQLHQASDLFGQSQKAWDQSCDALCQQTGVDQASVRSVRAWITTHRVFTDKYESLQQSQSRLAAANESMRRIKQRLIAAIESSSTSMPASLSGSSIAGSSVTGSELPDESLLGTQLPPGGLDEFELETLYDNAQRLRGELVESDRQIAQLKQKRRDTAADIPAAEAAYQTSVQNRKQWDQAWSEATQKLAGGQQLSPSIIDARLERLGLIQTDQRDRDSRLREMQSLELADTSFETRVIETARLLELELSTTPKPTELANRLQTSLQQAKSDFAERERLTKELSRGRQKLSAMNETLDRATAQLKELCNEAGVSDPSELPAVEQLSREKSKLIDERDNAGKQLSLVAAGIPIDEFADRVEQQTPDDLEQQIAKLDGQLRDLLPGQKESLQTVGAIKQELAKIDGGDRAAELNQDIQFLTAKIQRHAQEYAKLKVGSMILQRSIDHYRSENESPVLKIACDAFRELTCEKYSGLKAEYDENGSSKLFGVLASDDATAPADEVLVPVETMSLGTADALYLSMRLASLEHQLSGGQGAPVVIDDCLIQLDDSRTTAALQRFSDLSLKTQVILFTHHEHLIDLASKTLGKKGCHIHRLQPKS